MEQPTLRSLCYKTPNTQEVSSSGFGKCELFNVVFVVGPRAVRNCCRRPSGEELQGPCQLVLGIYGPRNIEHGHLEPASQLQQPPANRCD